LKVNTIFAKQLKKMIIELNTDERTWLMIAVTAKINSANENFKTTQDLYWSEQVVYLTALMEKL
jgi:hypothetical protein